MTRDVRRSATGLPVTTTDLAIESRERADARRVAPAHAARDAAIPSTFVDNRRRLIAIVSSASGNLVEWYDFYVYSFCALYFADQFFPAGDRTTQLLNAAAVFA